MRLTGTVLGNIFLWSGTVFYPFYLHGDAIYHISPLADQNIAGAIMMVEESILTLGLFCWLFLRTAREGEERQELLDFAHAHGLELTDARAARAVAAGRGEELRRRLEGARPSDADRATVSAIPGDPHVRRMRDGGGLGRDRLPDVDADPPLRLADAAAHARADDRRDVRRGVVSTIGFSGSPAAGAAAPVHRAHRCAVVQLCSPGGVASRRRRRAGSSARPVATGRRRAPSRKRMSSPARYTLTNRRSEPSSSEMRSRSSLVALEQPVEHLLDGRAVDARPRPRRRPRRAAASGSSR